MNEMQSMRKFIFGAFLTVYSLGHALAQDYSTDPALNKSQWDYTAGSRRVSPPSYEGAPPPPTQVIIMPNTAGYGESASSSSGVPMQPRNLSQRRNSFSASGNSKFIQPPLSQPPTDTHH
ncbi:hypothetical protein [Acetobacter nitrogenifigens]